MALRVDFLQVLGNYSLSTLFSRAHGASNTTFTDLYAEGSAKLKVAKEGYLEATNIELDISVTDIDVHFENPGLLGSFLQGAMNSAGTLIIDTIKPYILREVNSKMLVDANKNLRGLTLTFPNSLSPLDACIAEARKVVRLKGFDPFKVDDFTHTTGVLGLEVTQIWISGMSSFYRVGNITVVMENNTVYIGVSAGTKELQGKCNWEVSVAGLVSRTGKITFDIEYLGGDVRVNQSLDTRRRPNLESLHITLGNFQLQFDGAGTLDYVIEALVNILPNLLRNQIMLAVEEPLKIKIQEIFNEIDVEKEIYKQVEEFEKIAVNNNLTETISEKPHHEEGLTVDDSQLDDSIF